MGGRRNANKKELPRIGRPSQLFLMTGSWVSPTWWCNCRQPYVLLAGANTDSWPHFVLPVPVSGTRYVRGVEIRPGNPKIIHHCHIAHRSHTDPAHREWPDLRGRHGRNGWPVCQRQRAELDSRFLTWRPGSPPYLEPEGMTWRLDKDTDLILIMHWLMSGKSEPIQPIAGFYFSDKPPTKTPMPGWRFCRNVAKISLHSKSP